MGEIPRLPVDGGAECWTSGRWAAPHAAFGVTDDGRVFGESTTVTGETHAFSWTQEDGIADVGTLGGTFSYPQDVNVGGQVVGQSTRQLTNLSTRSPGRGGRDG